jgi:hypothetical protein
MSNHEDKTEGDGCNAVIMLLLAGWGLEAFWNFVIAPGCHAGKKEPLPGVFSPWAVGVPLIDDEEWEW